jgi:hypothetical protein
MSRAKKDLWEVSSGDSLSAIAKKVYGDSAKVESLARFNHIKNKDLIYPGQQIRLPESLDGLPRAETTVKQSPAKKPNGGKKSENKSPTDSKHIMSREIRNMSDDMIRERVCAMRYMVRNKITSFTLKGMWTRTEITLKFKSQQELYDTLRGYEEVAFGRELYNLYDGSIDLPVKGFEPKGYTENKKKE